MHQAISHDRPRAFISGELRFGSGDKTPAKFGRRLRKTRQTVAGDKNNSGMFTPLNNDDDWDVREHTFTNFSDRRKKTLTRPPPSRLVSLDGIFEDDIADRHRVHDHASTSRLSSAGKLTYINFDSHHDKKITLNKMLEIMTINDFTWFKSSRHISQMGRFS